MFARPTLRRLLDRFDGRRGRRRGDDDERFLFDLLRLGDLPRLLLARLLDLGGGESRSKGGGGGFDDGEGGRSGRMSEGERRDGFDVEVELKSESAVGFHDDVFLLLDDGDSPRRIRSCW